ncbi:delta-lactam-biosynthetic de-N-acetylase [Bacillus sp. B15-48]|uniref:delta-lactam-biosynthetic de-N-acetylase n=1 Tax=Bacillus sp. B15-48 TaxID=1548601 RepID=UPI00193FE70C|nr:delta-lactam-biosynthetic de-N-acetylase [Bacillus sp. B15-48]MBM4764433.1 delta-lactam-biosynthetic de-N-acetylase [Bacillus sp. B15-48]
MKKIIKIVLAMVFLFFIASPFAQSAVPNTPIHWGFKKGQEGRPADAGNVLEQLLEKYGAVYMGDTSKKEIYLTFDNGYENGYTNQILDVLKKEKVPATFFVTGHYLESAEDQVVRMVEEGHIVGNHSYYHPDLTQVDDARVKRELEKVRALTYEITGQKQMSYLRPPRGVFSERTLKLAKEAGYTHVLWSLAFVDWHTDKQRGWEYSYNNIMKQIHPGAILLLHTVSKDNADALEKVIKDLKKQGYTFKSLDDLFASKELDHPMLHKK